MDKRERGNRHSIRGRSERPKLRTTVNRGGIRVRAQRRTGKKKAGKDDTSVKRIREKDEEDLQIKDKRKQLEQEKEEEDADLAKGKRKKETMGRKAVSSVKRR